MATSGLGSKHVFYVVSQATQLGMSHVLITNTTSKPSLRVAVWKSATKLVKFSQFNLNLKEPKKSPTRPSPVPRRLGAASLTARIAASSVRKRGQLQVSARLYHLHLHLPRRGDWSLARPLTDSSTEISHKMYRGLVISAPPTQNHNPSAAMSVKYWAET